MRIAVMWAIRILGFTLVQWALGLRVLPSLALIFGLMLLFISHNVEDHL